RGQHALEPVEAVFVESAVEPEENECAGEAEAFDRTARGGRVPLQARAQVLVVGRQPIEPNVLLSCGHFRLRAEGEGEKILCVAGTQLFGLARRLEPLLRVLADRLQHPETTVLRANEVLVDQRLKGVETGSADLLGCRERPAGDE